MKPATFLRSAISLALLFAICFLASDRSFFNSHIASPFFAAVLLSLYLVQLRTRVSLREQGGTFLLFAVLAAFEFRFLGYPATWPAWLSLLGLASAAILVLRFIWALDSERRLAALTLLPVIFILFSEWCAVTFLGWIEHSQPVVLDLYLYSFDASTRLQLPFLVGQWFARFHGLLYACVTVYVCLVGIISLTYIGCLLRDVRVALSAFVAFMITGPIGVILYSFFPALGPRFIFAAQFPWHPLAAEQARRVLLEPIALAGPRNAMPSLHATWIFLVLWYARGLSGIERTAAALGVLLTLLAALGTGEHYFVDVVVAAPFTVMILALTNLLVGNNRPAQLLPFGLGLGGVTAWLLALRYLPHFFWRSPALPWLAYAVTFAVCFTAARGLSSPAPEPLDRAADPAPQTARESLPTSV